MSQPLLLDFAAPRVRTTFTGVVLLIVGVTGLSLACLQYSAASQRRAALELRLADAVRRASPNPADLAHSERQTAEATDITRELGTPWTGVLADLEAASHESEGKVSLLAVEPDHEKHRILIKAESKDLPLALAYLERLQKARSLRFPMLDSHEIVAEDKDHPVRFAMTAEWQESP
jgi:hypothetical protein